MKINQSKLTKALTMDFEQLYNDMRSYQVNSEQGNKAKSKLMYTIVVHELRAIKPFTEAIQDSKNANSNSINEDYKSIVKCFHSGLKDLHKNISYFDDDLNSAVANIPYPIAM